MVEVFFERCACAIEVHCYGLTRSSLSSALSSAVLLCAANCLSPDKSRLTCLRCRGVQLRFCILVSAYDILSVRSFYVAVFCMSICFGTACQRLWVALILSAVSPVLYLSCFSGNQLGKNF